MLTHCRYAIQIVMTTVDLHAYVKLGCRVGKGRACICACLILYRMILAFFVQLNLYLSIF